MDALNELGNPLPCYVDKWYFAHIDVASQNLSLHHLNKAIADIFLLHGMDIARTKIYHGTKIRSTGPTFLKRFWTGPCAQEQDMKET